MNHYLIATLLFALFSISIPAGETPVHPQLQRVIQLTEAERGELSLSGQMWKVRAQINLLDIVSDPVSDRYLITKLGGPIDLVHFLALCAQTCSGRYSVEDALMIQWKSEGGPEHEKGLSRTYYPEAHPDDLPSNAFGALLGSELKARENDKTADLAKILDQFFQPLMPVTDQQAKQYSHQYIVMGLPEKPKHETLLSRSEWFTATPIYLLTALDPRLKPQAPNATAALKLAGFQVYPIQNKPIGIRRLTK